jgi:leucyl aminopeptidase
MAGSAAVLGAADALAAAKPTGGPVVHLIAACCENLIGPDSLLPGDILTTASGKTVEVNNTDAEGRLILADAMWFAQEKAGAKALIDIATLTGACMVGLGQGVAAFYTPEEGTAAAVSSAARATGEKLWRMPLEAR